MLRALRRREVGIGGWVTMCIAMAVGLGAVTQALGVEAVLGAVGQGDREVPAVVAGILVVRVHRVAHGVRNGQERRVAHAALGELLEPGRAVIAVLKVPAVHLVPRS